MRVTFGLGLVFTLLHAVVTYLVFSVAIVEVSPLRMLPPPPASNLYYAVLTMGIVSLLGSPVFGYWWARLFVRLRSRSLVPGPRCEACGYNLTGNTSGRCPECGNDV